MNYLIVVKGKDALLFWAGRNWTTKHAEAKPYPSVGKVLAAINKNRLFMSDAQFADTEEALQQAKSMIPPAFLDPIGIALGCFSDPAVDHCEQCQKLTHWRIPSLLEDRVVVWCGCGYDEQERRRVHP